MSMGVHPWLVNLIYARRNCNRARIKAANYKATKELKLVDLLYTHPSRNRALIKAAKIAEEKRVAKVKGLHKASLSSAPSQRAAKVFNRAVLALGDFETALKLINQEGGLKLKEKDRIALLVFILEAPESSLRKLNPGALRSLVKDSGLEPVEFILDLLAGPAASTEKLKILLDELQITKEHINSQAKAMRFYDTDTGICGAISSDALYLCAVSNPQNTKPLKMLLDRGADPVMSRKIVDSEFIDCPWLKRKTETQLLDGLIFASPVDQLITQHLHPQFKTLAARPGAVFTEAEQNWLERAYNYLGERVKITRAERRVAYQQHLASCTVLKAA